MADSCSQTRGRVAWKPVSDCSSPGIGLPVACARTSTILGQRSEGAVLGVERAVIPLPSVPPGAMQYHCEWLSNGDRPFASQDCRSAGDEKRGGFAQRCVPQF